MNYAFAEGQAPVSATTGLDAAGAAPDWELETSPSVIDGDSWLISFIDVLTLLLTLFVLLLAYQDQQMDQDAATLQAARTETVSPAVEPVPLDETTQQEAFKAGPGHEPAALDLDLTFDWVLQSQLKIQDSQPRAVALESVTAGSPGLQELAPAPSFEPVRESEVSDPQPVAPGELAAVEHAVLTELPALEQQPASPSEDTTVIEPDPVAEFLEAFNESGLGDRVEVIVQSDSVNIEISERILFTPGSASLMDTGRGLLDELVESFKAQPYALSVEGHTDSVPIDTRRFPSNWELSSARATMVARHLIERGMSPDRIRAVGYADTRPRADNLTPEGKAKNRRVSFVLQIPTVR